MFPISQHFTYFTQCCILFSNSLLARGNSILNSENLRIFTIFSSYTITNFANFPSTSLSPQYGFDSCILIYLSLSAIFRFSNTFATSST